MLFGRIRGIVELNYYLNHILLFQIYTNLGLRYFMHVWEDKRIR